MPLGGDIQQNPVSESSIYAGLAMAKHKQFLQNVRSITFIGKRILFFTLGCKNYKERYEFYLRGTDDTKGRKHQKIVPYRVFF
jgi:hypothetical protein